MERASAERARQLADAIAALESEKARFELSTNFSLTCTSKRGITFGSTAFYSPIERVSS